MSFARLKIFALAAVLAIAGVAGVTEVQKAYATSPPTMTWGSLCGVSVTGGSGVGVVGTGATGQRIILQYANLAATGAGVVILCERSAAGVLTTIAATDCAAAGTVEFKQNDYFAGTGYTTGSGASLVIVCPATLTVTGNVRYLAN